MVVLNQIAFVGDLDALFEQVRVAPSSGLGEQIRSLFDRASLAARPRAVFDECYIGARSEETVTVGGVTFTSRALSANLAGVERVFPFVATCGLEFDTVLEDDRDDFLRFCLDCIKQSALSAALEHLRDHLMRVYGITRLAAMHPGSGDADVWPIEQQAPLFSLLGDVEGAVGVRLTDSFLMCPNKTVSGILFPTEVDFVTCQLCHREGCPNRRVPFDEHLWLARQGEAPQRI